MIADRPNDIDRKAGEKKLASMVLTARAAGAMTLAPARDGDDEAVGSQDDGEAMLSSAEESMDERCGEDVVPVVHKNEASDLHAGLVCSDDDDGTAAGGEAFARGEAQEEEEASSSSPSSSSSSGSEGAAGGAVVSGDDDAPSSTEFGKLCGRWHTT